MLYKNDEYIIKVLDLTYEGLGFVRIDNFPVFIENALIDEVLRIKIIKVTKKYAIARVVDYLEISKDRVEILDIKTTHTGTTPLQHLSYSKQLEFKTKMIKDLFIKTFKYEFNILDTIGSLKIIKYRNKAQIPVREKNGKLVTGFFKKNTHNLIEVEDFIIQDQEIDDLIIEIRDFLNIIKIKAYNESDHSGIVRNIIIRKGMVSKQIQVVLVFRKLPNKNILDKIIEFGLINQKINSLVLNINPLKTNVIMGDENILLVGNDYIVDELLGYKFKISSKSFYQINHNQTEKLYQKIIELADFKKNEIVLDAYCGIGTISICISSYVKKVYGIEIVKDAIEMANENLKINKILNCEFEVAAFEDVIEKYVKLNIDTIIVDPPRKGLDGNVINYLKKINPNKIIYVSCNPITLVRDLKALLDFYTLKLIQPLDMFPMTLHVETIALLQRR